MRGRRRRHQAGVLVLPAEAADAHGASGLQHGNHHKIASHTGRLIVGNRHQRLVRDALDKPAVLAFSVAACVVLAVAVVWLWISRGQLQREIANERYARQTSEVGVQQSIENARRDAEEKQRQLDADHAERLKLEQRLDDLERNKARPDQNLIAEANIPSVTLESSRDTNSAAQIDVPARAKSVRFIIPVEAGNRFQSYTVEIFTRSKALIGTISGAWPNRSRSLSVGMSAARLDSGDYRVKLYGVNQGPPELLGEYDLRVVKK